MEVALLRPAVLKRTKGEEDLVIFDILKWIIIKIHRTEQRLLLVGPGDTVICNVVHGTCDYKNGEPLWVTLKLKPQGFPEDGDLSQDINVQVFLRLAMADGQFIPETADVHEAHPFIIGLMNTREKFPLRIHFKQHDKLGQVVTKIRAFYKQRGIMNMKTAKLELIDGEIAHPIPNNITSEDTLFEHGINRTDKRSVIRVTVKEHGYIILKLVPVDGSKNYQKKVGVEDDCTFGELVAIIRESVAGVSAEQMKQATLFLNDTELQNDINDTNNLNHHKIYSFGGSSTIDVRNVPVPLAACPMIIFEEGNNLVVQIGRVALPRYVPELPRYGTYIHKLSNEMAELFDFEGITESEVTIKSKFEIVFRKRIKVGRKMGRVKLYPSQNEYVYEDFRMQKGERLKFTKGSKKLQITMAGETTKEIQEVIKEMMTDIYRYLGYIA